MNKSRRQHPTKHQQYGHLPAITKTVQARRTRHAGHSWRSRDELISDLLLWTPSYSRAKAGRPARTYIQQHCKDTGRSHEDLPEGEVAKEGQGYPCCRHDIMMTMMATGLQEEDFEFTSVINLHRDGLHPVIPTQNQLHKHRPHVQTRLK